MKILYLVLFFGSFVFATKNDKEILRIFIDSDLEKTVREFKGKEEHRSLVRKDFLAYLIYNKQIDRDQIDLVKFYATFRGSPYEIMKDNDEN